MVNGSRVDKALTGDESLRIRACQGSRVTDARRRDLTTTFSYKAVRVCQPQRETGKVPEARHVQPAPSELLRVQITRTVGRSAVRISD